MSSKSLQHWKAARAQALDEIRDAHGAVGGYRRGRRYATQQINHAYLVLLSSHFQGFCRDLHSEAVDYVVGSVQPIKLRAVLRVRFVEGRKLDWGNPTAGNLGADFGRLGMVFWDDVAAIDRRNVRRQKLLEKLNIWRNAIAHQDFDPVKLGRTTALRLKEVWLLRKVCDALADSFDRAVRTHLRALVGSAPW